MKERVVVLREAIVKITQMLAGKSIEVTQTGINAYVRPDSMGRPVLVNLPYLPDNAPESLCIAIQGFLDHEVAHILFSDFGALVKANKLGVKNLMNLLEDARIEKKMAQRFSGCAYNLGETGKFFLENFTTPQVEEAAKAGDARRVQGILMVPLIRALAGQQVWKEYIDTHGAAVKDIAALIGDLAPRMEAMETTQDALDLAVEVKKRMEEAGKEKSKGPSEKKKEKGGKGSKDEAESDPSDGEGEDGEGKEVKVKSKKKPKPEPKPEEKEAEDEDEEGDPKEKGGAKPEPKDEEEGAPDEEESTPDEGEGAPDEEESTPDEEEGAPDEEGVPDEEESTPDEEGAPDEEEGDPKDEDGSSSASDEEAEDGTSGDLGDPQGALDDLEGMPNGYDETLSKMITSAAVESASTAPYMIFSKDQDRIEPLKVGDYYTDDMFTKLESKVAHMVGPIQKDLERAISARTKSIYAPGFRSGRLHSSSLARLAMGDDRVFRRKHVATSKDVAVSLVVDMSGSMAGAKIATAAAAAYALSSVLERIGISHEVICFTTWGGNAPADRYGEVLKSQELMGRSYSRSEPLNMPVIKTFKDRLGSETKKRFGWLPNSGGLRNNADGECVAIAAERLMARPEAGKIMIVLSDGEPHAQGDMTAMKKHLKDTVAGIERAGVNVIGIGVMSEAVRKFYSKSIVINKIEDLPTQVVKELKLLLIK